MMKIDLDVTRQ